MIGKKLKKYRLMLEVTGETLANLAGIKRSYLSQIENEKKIPPTDTFVNIIIAMAKIAPFTYDNARKILTEERYQEFKSLIYIQTHTEEDSEITYVSFDLPHLDNNLQKKDYNMKIDTQLLNKDLYQDDHVDKWLRSLFFDPEYFNGNYIYPFLNYLNLELDDADNNIPSLIQIIRKDLFEWWYNFILRGFYISFQSEETINSDEMPIYGLLLNMISSKKTFKPYGGNKNFINIPIELLSNKVVSFDLKDIQDKNIRLTLNGENIVPSEIKMINVSLDAIRYSKEQKRQKIRQMLKKMEEDKSNSDF